MTREACAYSRPQSNPSLSRYGGLWLVVFAAAATWIFAEGAAALTIGDKPTVVNLEGEAGGLITGGAWSSDAIKGKVWTLFYVDPDEKDANPDLEKALKAASFPKQAYGSIAVINMDATWLPNSVLESSLEAKQKDYPDTIYVKDMNKALVKAWQLKDDAYVVVVFDKDGKPTFVKDGSFTKADTEACIDAIKKALGGA